MERPDWTKLTVPLGEVDAAGLVSLWDWLVGDRRLSPFELTRFGDWFLTDTAGAVHWLDILEGRIERVCSSLAEYRQRRVGEEELREWFQAKMVVAAYAAGHVPAAGQCLGYGVPPILGGSLALDNVVAVDVAGWQLFMSQLHAKLREVPRGARVTGLSVDATGELTVRWVGGEEK